jgi:transposase
MAVSVAAIIFAAAMGEAFYNQLVNVGIRTTTGHLQVFAKGRDFDIIMPMSGNIPKISNSGPVEKRELFSQLDLVFFDTTSIYFEGAGGKSIGQRGFSKDHRPDLKQMVVAVFIDDNGRPICCEMWPGNTADVKTLIPVTDAVRKRFGINRFCIVSDRGMTSANTIKELEEQNIRYLLGTRMRKVKGICSKSISM